MLLQLLLITAPGVVVDSSCGTSLLTKTAPLLQNMEYSLLFHIKELKPESIVVMEIGQNGLIYFLKAERWVIPTSYLLSKCKLLPCSPSILIIAYIHSWGFRCIIYSLYWESGSCTWNYFKPECSKISVVWSIYQGSPCCRRITNIYVSTHSELFFVKVIVRLYILVLHAQISFNNASLNLRPFFPPSPCLPKTTLIDGGA